jgi:hypothetical protein
MSRHFRKKLRRWNRLASAPCPKCGGLGYFPKKAVAYGSFGRYRWQLKPGAMAENRDGCNVCNGTGQVNAAEMLEKALTGQPLRNNYSKWNRS